MVILFVQCRTNNKTNSYEAVQDLRVNCEGVMYMTHDQMASKEKKQTVINGDTCQFVCIKVYIDLTLTAMILYIFLYIIFLVCFVNC